MLGNSADRRRGLGLAVGALLVSFAASACVKNVPQDGHSGKDAKAKGGGKVSLENGEGKAKGILNLAEVQVFSGDENIASKGTAKQSSQQKGTKADSAIDGKTDGDFAQTTAKDRNPRWDLDLNEEKPISKIVIWNRTDPEHRGQMKDVTIKLLSKHQGVVWEGKITEPPDPSITFEVLP